MSGGRVFLQPILDRGHEELIVKKTGYPVFLVY